MVYPTAGARCNFMPSSEQIQNFCSGVDVSIAQVSWSKWNHFYFLGLRIQPNSQGLINYVLGLKFFQSQPRNVLGFGLHPCLTVTDCSAASNLNDKRRSTLTQKYLADIILMCHDLLQKLLCGRLLIISNMCIYYNLLIPITLPWLKDFGCSLPVAKMSCEKTFLLSPSRWEQAFTLLPACV